MIEVKNLTKNYGSTLALDDVSLSFGDNRIYGLLGRNGAGKSTLLNVISGRVFADRGEATLDGAVLPENDRALSQLYLMSEKTYYPLKMKIKTVFKATKSFYPDFDEEYASAAAEKFGLKVNKSVGSLSTGFMSIFKLVIALSVGTPYLFLDEPVLGLDANNRDLFYKMLIERWSEKPFTVIISTHLIEEVANVVSDVIIVKNGRVIRDCPRDDLLADAYTVTGAASAVDGYISGAEVLGVDSLGGLKTAYIVGKHEPAEGLEITRTDLQRLFILLTNE